MKNSLTNENDSNINYEKLLTKIKKEYLEIFIDEIKEVSKLNGLEWAVTLGKGNIRIHFGNFIIFTLEKGSVWVPIKIDYKNENVFKNSFWEWDEKDYPQYKKASLFSKNGYFKGNLSEWNLIKEYHYKFLEGVNKKTQKLNKRTKLKHNSKVIILISNEFKKDIPIPDYEFDDESKILKGIKNDHQIVNIETLDKTEKKALVKNRIGQELFREKLIYKYGKCVLCEIRNENILRASHIKAWRISNNDERLDVNNGLLLCANHDLLFDRYLISFSKSGKIMISNEIKDQISELNIHGDMVIEIKPEMIEFLEDHNKEFNIKNIN